MGETETAPGPSLDALLAMADADADDPRPAGRDRAASTPATGDEHSSAAARRRSSLFGRLSRRRSSFAEVGWSMVSSKRRSSARLFLAKEAERQAARARAFDSLDAFWGRTAAATAENEAGWLRLLGPEGPGARALHAASQVMLHVKRHGAAEDAYAAEMLALSVALRGPDALRGLMPITDEPWGESAINSPEEFSSTASLKRLDDGQNDSSALLFSRRKKENEASPPPRPPPPISPHPTGLGATRPAAHPTPAARAGHREPARPQAVGEHAGAAEGQLAVRVGPGRLRCEAANAGGPGA